MLDVPDYEQEQTNPILLDVILKFFGRTSVRPYSSKYQIVSTQLTKETLHSHSIADHREVTT